MNPRAAAVTRSAIAVADPSEYRITAPAEVARLLGALRDGGVLLRIAVADGGAAIDSRLRTADASRRLLGFGADAADIRLPPLLAADRVLAAGLLDGVRLQFEVNGLLLVHGADACALRCAWPGVLWRFQRRGGYRVRSLPADAAGRAPRTPPFAREAAVPAHAPHAALRHPALAGVRLSLRVLDLSIGGCALLLPEDDVPDIAPGLRIDGVQLQLDAGTRIDAGLLLRHVSGNGGAGSRGLRLGCEWAGIAGDGERILQRWIDQVQRKRHAGR